MQQRTQWVVWRYESRNGKPQKIPYTPNGQRAETNNPATWTTYEAVTNAVRNNKGQWAGIGYVFSEDDPYCGIDFDACITPDGSLAAWAAPWIHMFKSYAEVSPSGTGIKVFLKGKKPDKCKSKVTPRNAPHIFGDAQRDGEKEPAIEVYDQGRYFTITGDTWEDSTDILDEQAALTIMLDFCGFLPKQDSHAQPTPPAPPSSNGNGTGNGHREWADSDYASWYLSRLAPWRADDYNYWLAVGMALVDLPNGLQLWDTWSQQSSKYTTGECARKWATFPRNPNGIALLGAWAKQDDPRMSNGNGNGNGKSNGNGNGNGKSNGNGNGDVSSLPRYTLAPEPHAREDASRITNVFTALEHHIRPTTPTTPTFPVHVFSGVWKQMLVETSHAVECDPAIAGTTLLAMASTVLQHNTTIQVNATREQNVNIYTTIAAPTGAGKTPIYSYFMKAIDAIEHDQAKEWQTQWETYKEQVKEDPSVSPPTDEEPVLYTTDTTSESLGGMLFANKGIGAVLSDEGDVFNTVLGRYERSGRIANLSTYLKAWDGRSIRVSRARKTQKLPTSALTVLIQTQPDILRELSSKREIKERGFLPRFLMCIAQDLRDQVTGNTTPVQRETLDEYVTRMKQLYHQGNRTLRLEPQAKHRIQAYQLTIRRQLKTTYRDVQEFAAKAENQILRLTGLLHTLHAAPTDDMIQLATIEKAITLFEYYLSFVMKEEVLLADTTESEMIVKLIQRLKGRAGETIYLSQIKKVMHITRRDTVKYEILEDTLTTLTDCGVFQEVNTQRKDSRAFQVMIDIPLLQEFVHVVHLRTEGSDIPLAKGEELRESGLCMSGASSPTPCASSPTPCASSEVAADTVPTDIPQDEPESPGDEQDWKDSPTVQSRDDSPIPHDDVHVVHVEERTDDIPLANGEEPRESGLCMSCASSPFSCASSPFSCASSEVAADTAPTDIPQDEPESPGEDNPQARRNNPRNRGKQWETFSIEEERLALLARLCPAGTPKETRMGYYSMTNEQLRNEIEEQYALDKQQG
jgi:hypothetical protein